MLLVTDPALAFLLLLVMTSHSHVGGIKDALLPFAASDYATAGKQPGDSGHLMMAPSTDDGTGDDVLVTA